MDNQNVLDLIPTQSKVTRELDMGEVNPLWKGVLAQVWVNAPGIIDEYFLRAETDANGKFKDMSPYKRTVELMMDWKPGTCDERNLDEALIFRLWVACGKLRSEYYDFLPNGSKDNSEPIAAPSTSNP